MYSHGCHRDHEPIVARPSTRATLSVAVRCMRAAAMAALLVSLAACSVFSSSHESPGSAAMLRSNLSVASAALAAGQPAVAHKVYLALAERFDDAPEPVLGLGYVALQANDLDAANDHFLNAAVLAYETPAIRAEALLGAGRIALAQGDTPRAREYLGKARDLAQGAPMVMWIENGLAVAAVLDNDYETAEAHYTEALKRPSGHPQIVANLVRMLIASGRVEEAAQRYGERNPSYWEEHDERALPRLIEEARAQQLLHRLNPDLLLQWSSFESLSLPPRDGARTGPIELAGALGLALRLADESALVMSSAAGGAPCGLRPHACRVAVGVVRVASGIPSAAAVCSQPSEARYRRADVRGRRGRVASAIELRRRPWAEPPVATRRRSAGGRDRCPGGRRRAAVVAQRPLCDRQECRPHLRRGAQRRRIGVEAGRIGGAGPRATACASGPGARSE